MSSSLGLSPDLIAYLARVNPPEHPALVRCREDAAFLRTLGAQCSQRAPLFAPAAEAAALRRLVSDLLQTG